MAESSLRGDLAELVSEMGMLKILECPVCLEIPFPPIFMCLKGHSICKMCKPELTKCPLCKSKISGGRNYIAENMILSSNHSCCYKNDGCQIVEKGDLIETHMKRCDFKKFKCPYYSLHECRTTTMKLSEVKQHLISTHNGTPISDEHAFVRYRLSETENNWNRKWKCTIFEWDGNLFIADLLLGFESKLIFFICLVGPEEEAKKYEGKVTLQSNPTDSPDDPVFEVTWGFPIKSITNQTINKFVLEEIRIFRSFYGLGDLKLIGSRDEENLDIFNVYTKYTILKRY